MLSAISLSVLFLLAGDSALSPPPVSGEPSVRAADPEPRAPSLPTLPPESARPEAQPAPAAEPHGDHRYAGLTLAPTAKNPLPVPKDEPPKLMWTGFSPNDAGGEIFLQTTRPVVHDLAVTSGGGARLVVLLRNTRIHARNNARAIDTSFFPTPVGRVSARQRKRDVELTISLRKSVVPVVRTAEGPAGTHLLVLSFPPGEPATAAADLTPRP